MTDTEKTKVNVPLLRKVLEHITANPWEWAQNTFAAKPEGAWARHIAEWYGVAETACKTSFCLAGHVANMRGDGIRFGLDSVSVTAEWAEDHNFGGWRSLPIQEFARLELGLTKQQADNLFAASNTLSQLWQLAADFTQDTDEPIVAPAQLPFTVSQDA